MKAVIFPGQGSQVRGMGASLFPKFATRVAEANDILGYSIEDLCLAATEEKLRNTKYTQPALYVVNALTYMDHLANGGGTPAMFAGHSLGEFNALQAAGAFDFATGLRLVKTRAELMGNARGGGMAAVIGPTHEEVRQTLIRHGLTSLHVANVNSPKQTILAGPDEDIRHAESYFATVTHHYLVLNVSGAFHSPYMGASQKKFVNYLAGVDFRALRVPVISNVTARPHTSDIGRLLGEQMTSEVKWLESIRFMWGKGIEEFIELGPGRVLGSLVAQIKRSSTPVVESESAEGATECTPDPPPTFGVTIAAGPQIRAAQLGSSQFRARYGIKYAYYAGSMYKGISSPDLVVRLVNAGLLGFLGTGGLPIEVVEAQVRSLKVRLGPKRFGANLLSADPATDTEERLVDLFLREGVPVIEASSFIEPSAALVRLRVTGNRRTASGTIELGRRIIAKLSRSEVAEAFLSPPPKVLVEKLLASRKINSSEAEIASHIPMADDICVEADSAGHTDQGVTATLLPAMLRLRDQLHARYGYAEPIHVGSGGGIGTPESVAGAVALGAQFVVTGSINQCTVEAGTSDAVKDLLQEMEVRDTTYAPAGDLFEVGGRVQVLKRGVFFPARANRLYELYRLFNSIDEIDEVSLAQLESKYFGMKLSEVWRRTEAYYRDAAPQILARALNSPKQKMALIFKYYFAESTRLALAGDATQKVNFQIHCGPALGAFNQWVKGTSLEDWRNRHVDTIAETLMVSAGQFLTRRLIELTAA